ncbi:hypothetical protein PPM_1640 [Paenibacillus polymyxa M1]|uniref:Uncharacterized protein n=1 Tax=Paenibacillus polymyxa (strain SC2) TaxID=886882 RepID=A0A0D5ZCF1_PAEPS|nr:hypothetical protein PPSC2_08635 [Paenibacillus polymyxa SC2]CCC84577.1 hypothetical protein PPM_1640 [Paenibacillus polymyxa M1]
MYDYKSIHSDKYMSKIISEVVEQLLASVLGFTKVSHLTFHKEVNGRFKITAVTALMMPKFLEPFRYVSRMYHSI